MQVVITPSVASTRSFLFVPALFTDIIVKVFPMTEVIKFSKLLFVIKYPEIGFAPAVK